MFALLVLVGACAKSDGVAKDGPRLGATAGASATMTAPRPSEPSAIPVIGAACALEGKRGCADNGRKIALVCSRATWQMATVCNEEQACSTGPGEYHGTCRPLIPQCEDRAIGQSFCAAGSVRACLDLVSFEDQSCAANSVCRLDGDSARCACAPGFEELDGACADIDECARGNGGCDREVDCQNMPGGHTCGGCAPGHLGGKDGVCTPALIDLSVSPGNLAPDFRPMHQQYAVSVPITAPTIDITATVPAFATVTINGAEVESGKAWRSALLALGSTEFEIKVSRLEFPSSTYELVVTRGGGQDGYLKADNARPADGFGGSLALSGDLLVVGAPGEDAGASGGEDAAAPAVASGAAYVFQRAGQGWVQVAYLKADAPAPNAGFGSVVAIAGDTIAVGAPGTPFAASAVEEGELASAPLYGSGAVYVFVREGERWMQQAMLQASNAGAGDAFGSVLGLSGDTLVVGAPREGSGDSSEGANDAAPGSGAAYVFVRAEEEWAQQALLKATTIRAGDGFGFAVAIDRDTAVIGAQRGSGEGTAAEPPAPEAPAGEVPAGRPRPMSPNPAPAAPIAQPRVPAWVASAGAAYVFTRDGVSWTQTAELTPPALSSGARFGYSVGVSGNTIVVGAPGETTRADVEEGAEPAAAVASGAAHVFVRSRRGWSEQATLVPTRDAALAIGAAGDNFGASVKIVGDTVLVGAFGEDSNAAGIGGDQSSGALPNSGAAYLFLRSGDEWSAPTYIKASNTRANDEFGRHTALSRDGFAVGASNEDSGARANQADASAPNAGAVYTFR